jgi:hypothetical protein
LEYDFELGERLAQRGAAANDALELMFGPQWFMEAEVFPLLLGLEAGRLWSSRRLRRSSAFSKTAECGACLIETYC